MITRSIALLTVILLGLLSRSGVAFIPSVIREYAGDALWALAAFLLIGLLAPGLSLPRKILAAILISFAVEFSQLYQAPWIKAVRDTSAGGMLLGHGFLWSDLVCYLVGISIGAAVERAFGKVVSRKRRTDVP